MYGKQAADVLLQNYVFLFYMFLYKLQKQENVMCMKCVLNSLNVLELSEDP